jgi:hypothetical protein
MCATTVLALDADSDYGSLGRLAPARAPGAPPAGRDGVIFEDLAQGAVTTGGYGARLASVGLGAPLSPSNGDEAPVSRPGFSDP